jgi:hypothetical protein
MNSRLARWFGSNRGPTQLARTLIRAFIEGALITWIALVVCEISYTVNPPLPFLYPDVARYDPRWSPSDMDVLDVSLKRDDDYTRRPYFRVAAFNFLPICFVSFVVSVHLFSASEYSLGHIAVPDNLAAHACARSNGDYGTLLHSVLYIPHGSNRGRGYGCPRI